MSEPRLDWALTVGHDNKPALPVGKNVMKVGCKHSKRVLACGACHARLYMALQEIEAFPEHASAIIESLFVAMKAGT